MLPQNIKLPEATNQQNKRVKQAIHLIASALLIIMNQLVFVFFHWVDLPLTNGLTLTFEMNQTKTNR